jgi:hypothetical protein
METTVMLDPIWVPAKKFPVPGNEAYGRNAVAPRPGMFDWG